MNSQTHAVVKEHEIFREQHKILCGSSTGRTGWRRWSFSGSCSPVTEALCGRLRNLGIREPNVSYNQENPRFWIAVNIQIFFLTYIITHCIMQYCFFKSFIHTVTVHITIYSRISKLNFKLKNVQEV